MLLDPLPSITRVFSLVIQQERELHLVTPSDPKILLAEAPQYTPSSQTQKTMFLLW